MWADIFCTSAFAHNKSVPGGFNNIAKGVLIVYKEESRFPKFELANLVSYSYYVSCEMSGLLMIKEPGFLIFTYAPSH